MGIKLLTLQMIPWCFPVLGGAAAAWSHPEAHGEGGAAAARPVRLIMADGRVEVFDRPMSAAELMKEHPKHLICRSDSFTIGQMIPALQEEELLKPGQAYFLLPLHFFQSVLSFVTLASSFALLHRPFDVLKTPSGKLQIRVSDDFIGRENGSAEKGGGPPGGRVCTTAALVKDYQQLVVGSRVRLWKPKLETIRESERSRRRLVAVGAAAAAALGDLRQRRKKAHRGIPRTSRRNSRRSSSRRRCRSSIVSPFPPSPLSFRV
ncbi:unnamed protein product [Spirodela intermedia]|uniref:Uncharacterized protein n=1 Tax=Spirodela intermedia TaxID=51605 RepID=A0A7I8J458_SPIIN|nr:unnamed protein product [Spirodela intermedia]CAA6664140.1 unnamed protein product [Spirodela intermedia]